MASFFESLWTSIFTPGASPTLLVATNASFAALQLVLFLLFLLTYSIHFVVLSFLCASLWWAINWFVAEVRVSQAAQEKEAAARKSESAARASEPTESETETESVSGLSPALGSMRPPPVPAKASGANVSGSKSGLSRSTEDVRQRHNPMDSSGYISTDSEWEKVDEKEK